MPANLSPEYKKAEQAFRAAEDDRERLSCLKEMLRSVPKHKGTEHLQADIKSRIKALTEELAGPRKGGARTGPVHSIRPEGAAQVALIGPPNSGKSSLHATLTGSRATVGPFPFTTQALTVGMCPFEDIHFQLIDTPPISAEHTPSWIGTALQQAAAALLVVDMGDPACTEQILEVLAELDARRITLSGRWPGEAPLEQVGDDESESLDPFRVYLPTLLIANKIDRTGGMDDLAALKELIDVDFPALAISVENGAGMHRIAPALFERLGTIRVYTKTPGKPPEMDKPFTLRAGATVVDVARLIHKDFAGSLRYARAWGSEVYDGQQVGPEHVVVDRDVIELHMH